MKVNGKHMRTVWLGEDNWSVDIIDQTALPHKLVIANLKNCKQTAVAIKKMLVRGAPLIGATAAYGMALAMREDASDENLKKAYDELFQTRPTAVNLRWALDDMVEKLSPLKEDEREKAAYKRAGEIADEDVDICYNIGKNGLAIIKKHWEEKGRPDKFNILTHCNAGWLATVDWGTALSPIYQAHEAGIPVHVWVDETRPRNQGASLTAWELGQHGVPHDLIVDNVGGHLMQHGMVDMCIVGTDRTTSTGDVCNKIGTYLKALAAFDNNVSFYVALPSPTIDWTLKDGVKEIPIEERNALEVTHMKGVDEAGEVVTVNIAPEKCEAKNYGFDVTPARLVTGLITEKGVCDASSEGLNKLFSK
jgi:methylthioribose-1-phosphate isomerase